jgi:predicted membrane channel-forming protein YqfA (hemolysin III family)
MRKQIERVFCAFETNLIPIIVAVLASFVLFAPAQFREIHRAFSQRLAALQTQPMTYENPELWSAIGTSSYVLGGLIVLSILLWLSCRANFDDPGVADRKALEGQVAPGALRFVSLSLAFLPFLGMAVGFYAASSKFGAIEDITKLLTKVKESILLDTGFDPALAPAAAADWAEKMASYNIILLGGAVVFILLGLLLVLLLSRLENSTRATALGNAMSNGYAAIAAAIIFLGLSVLYASQSGAIATRVSAVPILLMFAALSLVTVNYLAVQSGGAGRLVVWVLATVAVLFSLSDFTNNHRVRRVPYLAQAATMPALEDTFENWYKARTDQSKFSERYPVYIVAAQGGGIYAAMHAAHFLSYMQARCPNFAHHLFAISGVSGGSVGAATFAAAMKDAEQRGGVKIPDTGCADRRGEDDPAINAVQALDGDFWSPLQAMWLFPDLLQQFLPLRVEVFDRARALEHGLEASWERIVTQTDLYGPRIQDKTANTMAEPFLSLWPQGFDKSLFTPALVLNTTEVDTGRRRLISPFTFEGLTDLRFFPVSCRSDGKVEGLPLSTAAVLSARFPWITPTGWYYDPSTEGDCTSPAKSVTKLSDGGYFEASGVATALDLAHSLKSIIDQRGLNIDIKLVILTSGGFASDTADGLDEALDPIRTMLNASEARGYIEVGRAEQADFARATSQSGAVLKLRLEERGYPLPLGWSLSDVTRYLIQYQTGELNPCERKQGPRQASPMLDLTSSSCVIGEIIGQLTHK